MLLGRKEPDDRVGVDSNRPESCDGLAFQRSCVRGTVKEKEQRRSLSGGVG
jgi:hypothetical protein